jgi:membrane protein YqaA with SNARE-associated domain
MEYLYLFLSSFVSATLFPLGSEALLLYNLSLDLNVYLLLLTATIGNTLGSIVNYYFGLKGEALLIEKKLIKEKRIIQAKKYFDTYGAYSLLLSWVPIIGDPITFIAGIVQYDIKKFIVIVMFAKGGRYIFIVSGFYFFT